MRKTLPVFCALGAAALYALSAPLSKLLLAGMEPAMLAALLYLGAGLGTGALVLGLKLGGKAVGRGPAKNEYPFVAAMVLLDIAAPLLLLYGLRRTLAANVSLLNNFEIVATALIALLLFKERVSPRMWAAVALVTLASAMLSFEGLDSLRFSPGSLLVLAACVCWGFENNCTRALSQCDPLKIVAIKGLGSGGGALAIAFAGGLRLPGFGALAAALALGFVSYGLSITLYIRAQRDLGAARTSACYAVAPFVGALLSLLIFREKPPALFFAALAVMALGTLLTARDALSAASAAAD